jgi:hypothetical protein
LITRVVLRGFLLLPRVKGADEGIWSLSTGLLSPSDSRMTVAGSSPCWRTAPLASRLFAERGILSPVVEQHRMSPVATVYHRYLRQGEPEPAKDADADALKAKKAAADLQFVEEKKLQVVARRRETEIRNATRKRELIPRALVLKQAAFLVLSLRARLLAIPAQHAREVLNVSDEREVARRLDAIVRDALETLAEMPLKVSDPDWMQKLDDELEAASSKRPRRAAK